MLPFAPPPLLDALLWLFMGVCLIVGLLFALAIDEVLLLLAPVAVALLLLFDDDDEPVPAPDCRVDELDELLDVLLLLRFEEVMCCCC